MFDYLSNLQYIFLANVLGFFSGYLLSAYIDNQFFNNAEITEDKYTQVIKTALWSNGVSLFLVAIDVGAAAIDYLLISNFSTDIRFFSYDSSLGAFCWGFFFGMINTLMKFFESLFFSRNSDR